MKEIRITDYIGIPYKNKGRTVKGTDCYGLILLIYKVELGIELPDPLTDAEDLRAVMGSFRELSKQFKEVDKPEDFDIVAMSATDNPFIVNHFGLYYKGKILHILKDTKSTYMDPKFLQIKGYYRWQN